MTVEFCTDCPGNGGTLIPNTSFTWTAIPDDGFVYILRKRSVICNGLLG